MNISAGDIQSLILYSFLIAANSSKIHDFFRDNIGRQCCNMPGIEQIQCILTKTLNKSNPLLVILQNWILLFSNGKQ